MAGVADPDGGELPDLRFGPPTTFGRPEPASSSRDVTPRDAGARPQGFQAACAPLTEKSEVRSLIQVEHQKTRTYLADLVKRSASTARGELAEHHQALRELVDGAVARQAPAAGVAAQVQELSRLIQSWKQVPAAGVAAQIQELQLQVRHLGASMDCFLKAPARYGPDGADGPGQQQRQRQDSQCTPADETDDGFDSARKEPQAALGGGEDLVQLLGYRGSDARAADELASTRMMELLHTQQTESLLATQSECFDRLELMVRQALLDYSGLQRDVAAQGGPALKSRGPLRASNGGRGSVCLAPMKEWDEEDGRSAPPELCYSGGRRFNSSCSTESAQSPPPMRRSTDTETGRASLLCPPRDSRLSEASVGSAAACTDRTATDKPISRHLSRRNASTGSASGDDPADVMALRWMNKHAADRNFPTEVVKMLANSAPFTGAHANGCALAQSVQVYSTMLVVMYIGFMGIQVDQELVNMRRHMDPPGWSWWCDLMFALAFTLELFLRVYVDRLKFISGPARGWNLFDTLLITTHLIEVLFRAANFGILRALTGFRALRAARLVRSLSFIRELRLMVAAIRCSLRSVGWAFFLISFIVYLAAISTMQFVEFQFGKDASSHDIQLHEEIFVYYGRLGTSMLSLFMAISGGDDWRNLSKPLEALSMWCSLGYVLYIIFLVFGIMNILTAIFVESAKQVSEVDKELAIQQQQHKERTIIQDVKGFLTSGDADSNGVITKEELERMLQCRETVAQLKIYGWGATEARGLFQLLDIEETGQVSVDEFTYGMLRLKGAAKSLDIATMMYENKRIFSKINLIQDTVARNHQDVLKAVAASREYERRRGPF